MFCRTKELEADQMKPILNFSQRDFEQAYEDWHCNCGPTALAAALGRTLAGVRGLIPNFEERRYTSPTMMRHALDNAGQRFVTDEEWPIRGLVRIQFTGPWTAEGANPRWAYWHTHWVASFGEPDCLHWIFDCNGGLQPRGTWEMEILPLLIGNIKRADGWTRTHNWEFCR